MRQKQGNAQHDKPAMRPPQQTHTVQYYGLQNITCHVHFVTVSLAEVIKRVCFELTPKSV